MTLSHESNRMIWSVLIIAIIFGALLAGPPPAHAAKRQACVYSPTRGWELVNGRKACRVFARKFVRVTRRFADYRPVLSGCSSRRPRRIWRCVATKYRTGNIERGDIVKGRFVRGRDGWRVFGLRFPAPRY